MTDHTPAVVAASLPRIGFIGTGIGVWDFTHGDTVAPTLLFQGGRQVWQASGPKQNEMLFVVSGRLRGALGAGTI